MSRKIFVTKKSATKIQKGNPLIVKDDLVNDMTYDQGTVVHVYEGKRFLASALLGEQHKGIAWIIDRREINQIDKEWLLNRLQTAFEKRKKMRIDANAYRLFNAEGDGLGGLTIDYYNQHLQVTFYNRGIYQLQSLLVDCLLELIEGIQSIYEKCRFIDSPYVSKKNMVHQRHKNRSCPH